MAETQTDRLLNILKNRTSKAQGITASELASHLVCDLQSVYMLVNKTKAAGHQIESEGRPAKYWMGGKKSAKKKNRDRVGEAYRILRNAAEARDVELSVILKEEAEKIAQKEEAREQEKKEKVLSRIRAIAEGAGIDEKELADMMKN